MHSNWFRLSFVVVGGTSRRIDGTFWCKKMEDMLATHFFWPRMKWDVERSVVRCVKCQKSKSRLNPHGLYMPLPILSITWADISIDFILVLSRTKRGRNIVFVVVDCLRWHTLFLVIKATMLFILLTFSFKKLFAYMGCLLLLFQMVMQNSWVIFGTLCEINWGQNYFFYNLSSPNYWIIWDSESTLSTMWDKSWREIWRCTCGKSVCCMLSSHIEGRNTPPPS
jgi:hypothetical protein